LSRGLVDVFTRQGHGQTFTLSMADARGRWGETGETGSLDALLTILIEQWGFVLVDWS
jgi:hypothetical protein